jgi:hypothetical protein
MFLFTTAASLLYDGHQRFFPSGKRPGHEAGHLYPLTAKAENAWSCASLPPPPPHTYLWCLVQDRERFAFLCRRKDSWLVLSYGGR